LARIQETSNSGDSGLEAVEVHHEDGQCELALRGPRDDLLQFFREARTVGEISQRVLVCELEDVLLAVGNTAAHVAPLPAVAIGPGRRSPAMASTRGVHARLCARGRPSLQLKEAAGLLEGLDHLDMTDAARKKMPLVNGLLAVACGDFATARQRLAQYRATRNPGMVARVLEARIPSR
jgi:hypothetical protein